MVSAIQSMFQILHYDGTDTLFLYVEGSDSAQQDLKSKNEDLTLDPDEAIDKSSKG